MNLGSGTLATNDASSGISSGSLAASYQFVGLSGTGTFTQTGGTNNIVNGPYLGYNSGDNGTYNLGGSGYLSGHIEYVGNNGNGTFRIRADRTTRLSFTSELATAVAARVQPQRYGYLSASDEEVGFSGTGSLMTSPAGQIPRALCISETFPAAMARIISTRSGYLQGLNQYLGWSGTGSFTQSGGTNSSSNILALGYNNDSSGTYNLNGGLLTLPGVAGVSGTSVSISMAARFESSTSSTSFFRGLTAAYVKIGGANIDVQGFNDTVSQTCCTIHLWRRSRWRADKTRFRYSNPHGRE